MATNGSKKGGNKAVVYSNPGTTETEVRDLEIPEPGPGEVLVKISHSGVCHSDYGIATKSWSANAMPFPTPEGQVGGHEGVGKVVKQGPGVTQPEIGARVGIKWIAGACLNCETCLIGLDGGCANLKVSGYFTPGTFQQYTLAPANYVTPIPDGVDSAEAAPLLCGGVTVFAGLKKAQTKPGDWVVIAGAGGGLGHLATQLARNSFSCRVIGIDRAEKEDFCKKHGVDVFIDFAKFDNEALTKKIKEVTEGYGAHCVLVANASNKSYDQAVSFLRHGGSLICIGIPEGEEFPIKGATATKIVVTQAKIIGSAVGNRHEAIETLRAAARGDVKSTVRLEPMEKLTEIFNEMHAGKLQGRVVLQLPE